MLTRRWLAPIAAATWLLVPRAASAQATAQIPLQFDFLNPGARSLSMGGAFLGAADDATAAFTNPAGLAFLKKREVSVEGRYRRVETPFLAGGRISGQVTGNGLDTINGPVYDTDVDSHFGLAFASGLLPRGRYTVTAYFHQLARIHNTIASDGVFQQVTLAGITSNDGRDSPLTGDRNVNIMNYGAAVGVTITPKLSIGGGLSIYHFSLSASFQRLGFQSTIFSPPDPNLVTATATQDGHDISVSGNLGALWKATKKVQIGGTFRYGPAFTFSQTDTVPDAHFVLTREGQFKVPTVTGAGVQWTPSENWRVLADYVAVFYGELKTDYIDFQTLASGRPDQVKLGTGHEVHGGAEYSFVNAKIPTAVRFGAWFDPDHAPHYESTAAHDQTDILFTATLPGGKNLVHGTFGVGLVPKNWFELNAGADISSRTTYVTVSGVFRF
jgi:long-subunit fatty acid transport protein